MVTFAETVRVRLFIGLHSLRRSFRPPLLDLALFMGCSSSIKQFLVTYKRQILYARIKGARTPPAPLEKHKRRAFI